MQIASHCRLSIACSGAVIVRVQIVYPLVFTNGPLRDRKAVLIAHPSENVPSHHFRTVIILAVEIVVSDRDITVCWLPILGAQRNSRNSSSRALATMTAPGQTFVFEAVTCLTSCMVTNVDVGVCYCCRTERSERKERR